MAFKGAKGAVKAPGTAEGNGKESVYLGQKNGLSGGPSAILDFLYGYTGPGAPGSPGSEGFYGGQTHPRSWDEWRGLGVTRRPWSGVEGARELQLGARGGQLESIDLLRDYATGTRSVAAHQTAMDIDRLKVAMASDAVAGGAQAQYRALAGGAGAMPDVAAQAGARAAQEQQMATEAMLQGAGAMRGQDIGLMGKEASWWDTQMQANLAEQQIMQQYMQMGMDEREASLAAQRQLAALALEGRLGAAGIGLESQALDLRQQQMDWNKLTQILAGVGTTASQFGGYISSLRGEKKDNG